MTAPTIIAAAFAEYATIRDWVDGASLDTLPVAVREAIWSRFYQLEGTVSHTPAATLEDIEVKAKLLKMLFDDNRESDDAAKGILSSVQQELRRFLAPPAVMLTHLGQAA